MTQQNRNRLLLVLVLALPTAIFIGSIFYNGFSVPPLPPMPNPNGYDDLMKAATMLAPDVASYNATNLDELQSVVATDAAALELARAGLQKKCRVALDYTPNLTYRLVQLPAVKNLARDFMAEGDLAEIQGHPEQAVKSYLDVIHLANEASRGGVLIDQLVGIAVEREGTDGLQRLLPQLDAKTCRETAATLENLDAQRQTWNDVMWQEHYYIHKTYPGIGHQIMRIVQYNSLRKNYTSSEQRFDAQQTTTRKLAIDFATRAYELDKGHPPAKVTDLVTNYLQTIPIDPATGTNMTYLPK
jgi:hypothetical protein